MKNLLNKLEQIELQNKKEFILKPRLFNYILITQKPVLISFHSSFEKEFPLPDYLKDEVYDIIMSYYREGVKM